MSDEDMSIQQAYEILGLDVNATDDEVKKSFNKLALEAHPDRKKTDGEELRKIIEARDIILYKKNELDVISKVIKSVTENFKNMDLKKTQLLELKNGEIKEINNRFIRKSIYQIGPLVVMLFIINSLKDLQPYLERIFDTVLFSTEIIAVFNFTMLIAVIMGIFLSLSTLLHSRSREIEIVDERFGKQLEELMTKD